MTILYIYQSHRSNTSPAAGAGGGAAPFFDASPFFSDLDEPPLDDFWK